MASKTSGYETMGTVVAATDAPVASVVEGKDFSNALDTNAGTGLLQGGKRGHKCCGGCCDVRRAVIIVDTVRIVMTLFGIWSVFYLKDNTEAVTANMTDDQKIADYNTAMAAISTTAVIIGASIAIVCQCLGVLGALQYNYYLVAVAAVALCVDLVFALIGFNIVGLVELSLFLYPHVMLIQEIRSGIMTKENYPNEQHSCCCV